MGLSEINFISSFLLDRFFFFVYFCQDAGSKGPYISLSTSSTDATTSEDDILLAGISSSGGSVSSSAGSAARHSLLAALDSCGTVHFTQFPLLTAIAETHARPPRSGSSNIAAANANGVRCPYDDACCTTCFCIAFFFPPIALHFFTVLLCRCIFQTNHRHFAAWRCRLCQSALSRQYTLLPPCWLEEVRPVADGGGPQQRRRTL
jgi:hypothetical protein